MVNCKQKQRLIFWSIIFLTIFLIPQNGSAILNIQADSDLMEIIDPQIQRLKEEIQQSQKNIDDLQKQQAVYEESLKVKRREINNLNNQLGILDDTIAKVTLETQANQLQIELTNLEIQNLNIQINQKNEQLTNQKEKIGNVLRQVDRLDRKTSHLEILILEGTISSFFKELNELQLLESNLKDDFTDLNRLREELNAKKDNLEKRKEHLDNLHTKLQANQERLSDDKVVKNYLLSETKGQEGVFQQLLAEAKAEQDKIESEIQNLEVEARRRILETQGVLPSDDGFIWPVASRKITSYFHDPDYPFRYIFEHPAIDIGQVSQGTAVRAARSGYVAKVKFDGTNKYGYILIVHTGGLSTVYGHISRPYVKEDDFVVQGEVIALSGGTPGTAGAGRLTTGPHLHFEIRLNGIPVDPLKYLP